MSSYGNKEKGQIEDVGNLVQENQILKREISEL